MTANVLVVILDTRDQKYPIREHNLALDIEI